MKKTLFSIIICLVVLCVFNVHKNTRRNSVGDFQPNTQPPSGNFDNEKPAVASSKGPCFDHVTYRNADLMALKLGNDQSFVIQASSTVFASPTQEEATKDSISIRNLPPVGQQQESQLSSGQNPSSSGASKSSLSRISNKFYSEENPLDQTKEKLAEDQNSSPVLAAQQNDTPSTALVQADKPYSLADTRSDFEPVGNNDENGLSLDSSAEETILPLPPSSTEIPESNPENLTDLWWQSRVTTPILGLPSHQELTVQSAIYQALENSRQIRAISQDPLIQETEIDVAVSQFDPNLFAKSMYDDRVDPVGNTLTTGGLPFLKDNIWTGVAGVKRKTVSGADVSMEQKLGFQNSNSRFFTPQDQGTAVLSLNFEQPLMRGRGQFVNRSQIVIAQTNTDVAWDIYCGKLQDELLNVVEAYWNLYASRAFFLQKTQNLARGEATLKMIEGRQGLDTQAIQVAQARAAVQSRKTELANAYRDIRLWEAELRRLLGQANAIESQNVELVTAELPLGVDSPMDLVEIAHIALQNRPELRRAVNEMQVAAIRNQVASNQILPDLSLIFGTYVAGLAGDSGIETAWQRQFVSTTPGFSAGLNFEFPWRNRAARGKLRQRELELVQSQAMVEQATIDITTDVQKAFWRLKSATEKIDAAKASMDAANIEYDQNVKRWDTFAITEGDWSEGQTQSLVLDQLLLTQQKVLAAENIVTEAEAELKNAQVYLRRAMGTLIDCARAGDPAVQPNVQPVFQPDDQPNVQPSIEQENAPSTQPDGLPVGSIPNNLRYSDVIPPLAPPPGSNEPAIFGSNL